MSLACKCLFWGLQFERMSGLKEIAPWNICCIFFTLDTSHFEMSALKHVMSLNKLFMFVTRDTSHSPIGAIKPLR